MDFSKLPTFYIIGAAKSGTTSISDYLRVHPQVYLPARKELMFFNREEHFAKGVCWYSETYFKKAESYPAKGEASPHYLYWSEKVASRLRELYKTGEAKFIVSFRDPVQRAYSAYWNAVKEGKEHLTFAEALAWEQERLKSSDDTLRDEGSIQYGYFWGGCYATQLRPFLEQFPRDNFLFLLHEDLKDDPEGTMAKVFDFIGVDSSIEVEEKVSNPATMPRVRILHQFVRERSAIKEMIKPFLPSSVRYRIATGLVNLNLKKVPYPPIDDGLARTLRRQYHKEIEQLEELIGRDLSHWKARD